MTCRNAAFTVFLCACISQAASAATLPRGYSIPLLDLADQKQRQVVVDKEPGQYLGHPTTVLLEDGKTMVVVYPKGHGRGAIVMKRSTDGGLTWSDRLETPKSWATSKEVPTIYRTVDAKGVKRLIMFSGLYPCRMAVSEDDGANWTELKSIGDFGGVVTMASCVRLKNGNYLAFFHDDGRFMTAKGKPMPKDRKKWKSIVYVTESADGGLTWSKPREIATHDTAFLCEPGVIRSPDGKQLACLLRENHRRHNSFVIFSNDEGKTWTKPRELPGSLTGDRHTGRYAPDGRLFISFRDTTLDSPTKGDWVGWVGTYDDIVKGREGQYRVRLMDNTRGADCAYPGVEILPDGTFVTTTYGHWIKGEKPFIVSVRFKLEELDAMAIEKQLTKTDLFTSGQGYPSYRIPSMVVTPKGTILALCEGRQRQHDHAQNDLVLRRSTDLGKTWMPRQLVVDDGRNSLNDPSMVVDRKTGRVMILYTRLLEGFHTDKVVPGFDREPISRSLLVYSDDEGATWSKPREITRQVKNPKATATVFAPGMGLQLRFGKYKDRIIVPMWKATPGMPGNQVYVAYSDDGGENWKQGADLLVEGKGGVNESQVVELVDGSIAINGRSWGGPHNRKTAYSKDGGATWSPFVDEPALPEPNCQASLIRLSDPRNGDKTLGGKSRILYSGPVLPNARANGTIRLSYDDGKTWPVGKQIEPGKFYAYSALAVLPDGSIGVLYEGNGYQRVTFARFTLDWLTDGKDSIK